MHSYPNSAEKHRKWYGPITIREWNCHIPWKEISEDLNSDSVAWIIVNEGSWRFESVCESQWIREGGVLRSIVKEIGESAQRFKPRHWSGWLVVLDGDRSKKHADFLRRRYGVHHYFDRNCHSWQMFLDLKDKMTEPGCETGGELLAFEWISLYHEFLETTRVAFHELFNLQPGDPRLMEFAGLSVKDLAFGLGVTRSHLARRLKSIWGKDPGEVLRDLRMDRSRELLKTTDLPVSEICQSAGYRSISGFYEAFEKRFNETPNQFRERSAKCKESNRTDVIHFPKTNQLELTHEYDLQQNDSVKSTDWDGPYFQILTCGKANFQARREFEVSLSILIERITVVVALDGEAVFEANNRSFTIKPGMAVSYMEPINARWIAEPGKMWKRLWIQFHGELARTYFREIWAKHGNIHQLDLDSDTISLLHDMSDQVRSGRIGRPISWSRSAFNWLRTYSKELDTDSLPYGRLIQFDSNEEAAQTRKPKTLAEFSEKTGYSLSHIQSKMSVQWNESPGKTLRHARLDLAAKLLRTTNYSVFDISKEVGYATSSAFIRAFTKRFRMTPLHYRQIRRVAV